MPQRPAKELLLFTGSYPYPVAAENTFLPQELNVLGSYFQRIVVAPVSIDGEPIEANFPNVSVETGFAKVARSKPRRVMHSLLAIVDGVFLAECFANRSLFVRHPRAFRRALAEYARSKIAEEWIRGFVATKGKAADWVICTWWFDGVTWGASRFANAIGIPVVTRAHGYDLYEARHHPPYIPFRAQSLEAVTNVYADSEAGARYVMERYPRYSSKVAVGRLGVEDPGFLNPASDDGTFRLLSCSFILPVKRIDLIVRGLAELARRFPDRNFEWTHIGSGSTRSELASLAANILPPNARASFMDYPGKEALYRHYRERPIDMFLNVSQSEGTPVAIMEAMSVGIPVLATAVGGNKEIVGPENGVLVGSDPEPVEIAAALAAIFDDHTTLRRFREGSRARWQRSYSSQVNYASFAASIKGGRGPAVADTRPQESTAKC